MRLINRLIIFSLLCSIIKARNDVTIVGYLKFADGIGRHPIGWMQCLHESCKINFISTKPFSTIDFTDVPKFALDIIKSKDTSVGKVSIFVDLLSDFRSDFTGFMPDSEIKIAFSMLEGTALPNSWVNILNKKFDCVVVPDEFLVKVFKDSGVKIPVFVLPWGAYLEDFLNLPPKSKINNIFTFGLSAAYYPRKNQDTLIDAFAKAFKNNKKIQLIIHGRGGLGNYFVRLKNKVRKLKLKNVHVVISEFNREQYKNFIASLDCYVFPSKGEGFSITPREALAVGLPCIVTDNTAHGTICRTGFVRSVPSQILEPAYYDIFRAQCGFNFNCIVNDLAKAMLDVYSNYDVYLQKAHASRHWVSGYLFSNIKDKYVSLVKPKRVILSDKNVIESDCIMTSSQELYKKYLSIIEN